MSQAKQLNVVVLKGCNAASLVKDYNAASLHQLALVLTDVASEHEGFPRGEHVALKFEVPVFAGPGTLAGPIWLYT